MKHKDGAKIYGIKKNTKAKQQTHKEILTKKEILSLFAKAGISSKHLEAQLLFSYMDSLALDEEINLINYAKTQGRDINFFSKLIKNHLIIPNFEDFSRDIAEIYREVKPILDGHVATYIPQLARVNPNYFAVSVCTVDGQIFSIGDFETYTCVQSGCKPINYCIIQEEHGEEVVHHYIGKEPSGHGFNTLSLNDKNLPHNPLVNAGAIMACSLMKKDLDNADRFDFLMSQWKALCGYSISPRFNNAVYLSEKNTADRNYAIGHFIREKHVFPEGIVLDDVLEFYFQCCSIEMTTQSLAVVAGTLANAGVCPLTSEAIFHASHVKNCLSLMSSCGMYDFSGEFAFSVGLPAKSGVSGVLYVVVPNVMGICIWSPPLDNLGNPVRGLEFCRRLISRYNFHTFDSLIRSNDKKDPRYKPEI